MVDSNGPTGADLSAPEEPLRPRAMVNDLLSLHEGGAVILSKVLTRLVQAMSR